MRGYCCAHWVQPSCCLERLRDAARRVAHAITRAVVLTKPLPMPLPNSPDAGTQAGDGAGPATAAALTSPDHLAVLQLKARAKEVHYILSRGLERQSLHLHHAPIELKASLAAAR